jgi:hypothetical protein
MQVAGDKAAAILGVGGGVGSAKAGAETIGVVRIGVEVGMAVGAEVGMEVGTEVGMKVGTEVGMKVGTEVRMATAGEIRKAGLVVKGFKRFEVEVSSSGKS